MRVRSPHVRAILGLALVALALLALPAAAAEQTRESYARESYVTAVEPICKTDQQASDRYLTGVKALVRTGKLKQASSDFSKAATALEKARKQLADVPQPPEDAAKLGQWLAGIKGEVGLMRTIAAELEHGDKAKASALSIKLSHNATATNNLVIAFQFKYCKVDPGKYS